MRRSTLLIGFACALVAGCAQQLSRQEIAVEAQLVRERVTAWGRAFSNRVARDLDPFYHQVPELTVAWPTGDRTRGWGEQSPAAREYFRNIARMNVAVQDIDVQVMAADVAVATFRHSSDLIYTDTSRDIYSGQGTQIWIKDPADGVWKIHAEQISRSPSGEM